MKANLKQPVFLLIVILCLALAAGCATQKTPTSNAPATTPPATTNAPAAPQPAATGVTAAAGYGAAGAAADKDLTVEKMLVYAIQDEYLAHGEYEYVLSKFGDQRPFNNIVEAEVQHIAELKILFDKYKLAVPADMSKDHIIPAASMDEALKIGVQAEIDNIAMYKSFLNKDLPEDVKSTFNFLLNGSQNHLEAFQRNQNR